MQEFLDNHPWTKSGQIVCVGEANMAAMPDADKEEQAPEVPAEAPAKRGRKAAK
jgi:hypothetical protein